MASKSSGQASVESLSRDDPRSDPRIAIEFLELLRPGGPWVLTGIIPDGPTQTITATSATEVSNFVRANNGKKNLYYSVNPTRTAMTSKAKKSDIAAIEYFLADLDPEENETPEAAKARYLATLETHKPMSTAIIDSGNGIQVLWRLAEPIPLEGDSSALVADVEGRVKALMEKMGSVAGTQNIDRILRLPGTTNLPNKKKREHGRVPCPTSLIRFNGATCAVDDFPPPALAPKSEHTRTESPPDQKIEIDWDKVAPYAGWLKNVADLPLDFNVKGTIIVAHVGNLKELNADLEQAGVIEKNYASWSEVSMALTAILKADGRYTPERIAAALMCDLPCNRHVTKVRLSDQRRIVERLLNRSYEPTAQRIARMLDWREVRANGSPIASYYNVRLGIKAMGIDVRHDLFRDVTIVGFKGDEVVHEVEPLIGELTNAALLRLRHLFSEKYCFDPEDKNVLDAVKSLAYESCFDPIKDMLTEAEGKWDRKQRLDTWVVDYLGCEATELNCAIGRKVLIAAVHRARAPGCKFDNITVLESPEGTNKSTAIRVIAGDEFFSDQSILGVRDKEVQEQLAGVWMHESADLAGMRRADVEHVKSFASRQVDRGRPAYGRVVEKIPRRSIEWATTNDSEYLQSQTGNRRFWPLAVGLIDIEKLKRDRLQLLGEAAKAESAGESVTLAEALWPDAEKAQEERRTKDPWEDLIAAMGHKTWGTPIIHVVDNQERVASSDLLTEVLSIPNGQQHRGHAMRLANVMKRLGWERDGGNKVTIDGKQVRGYFRPVPPVTKLDAAEATSEASAQAGAKGADLDPI